MEMLAEYLVKEFFGLFGLVVILIAWIPGIIDTVKSGKPGMKKRFMVLYFIGSASLGFYAYQLESYPFMVLNVLAAIVPLIHLYYYIKKHGADKVLVPSDSI